MNANQRQVWERNLGTIGYGRAKWREHRVAEIIDELAPTLTLECPWCECTWRFHTQEQLDAIHAHMKAHFERFNSLKAQAALSVLSLEDRANLSGE